MVPNTGFVTLDINSEFNLFPKLNYAKTHWKSVLLDSFPAIRY